MTKAPPPRASRRKVASRKPGAAALGELARAHTEAALQVLAEVAARGTSEASRISAAMALLDRGYGKAGAGLTDDRVPVLYQRIELIDGSSNKSGEDHPAADRQD